MKTPTATIPALYTPAEVAERFRVDAKTVTRWAQAGKLPCIVTLGGHRRYPVELVDELLVMGADRPAQTSTQTDAQRLLTLLGEVAGCLSDMTMTARRDQVSAAAGTACRAAYGYLAARDGNDADEQHLADALTALREVRGMLMPRPGAETGEALTGGAR